MSWVGLGRGLALSLVLQAATAGLPAGPQLPPDAAVDRLTFGHYDSDVTRRADVRATWSGAAGRHFDVEGSWTESRAPARAAWEPLLTDTSDDGLRLEIPQGWVLCLRVRYHSASADAPWTENCLMRAWGDQQLHVVGHHRHVPLQQAEDRQATLLGFGARLEVGGLRPGMRVGVLQGANLTTSPRPFNGWFDPDGTHRQTAVGGGLRSGFALYPVRGAGTGWFRPLSRAGAAAIFGVAVLPEWFPLAIDSAPPWPVSVPLAPPHGLRAQIPLWDFLADRHARFDWYPVTAASDARTELQVQRGPMIGPEPPWRAVPLPRYAVSRSLTVRQGEVVCARVRTKLDDGTASSWAPAWCVVRPLDDRSAVARGPSRPSPDPTSADALSRRLVGQGRLLLRGVRAGGRFGVMAYVADWRDLGFVLDVPRGDPTPRSGPRAGRPYPEIYWVPVRHAGRGVVRSSRASAPSSRISSLFFVPPWAISGLSEG